MEVHWKSSKSWKAWEVDNGKKYSILAYPLRLHMSDPATSQYTLTPVETERVLAVLEETLDKLQFLGSITPDVLAHRDELSQFVGDEISRIIQDQRQLEKRYEELILERGNLKGLANKSKYKENQREIQDVSRKLRESTKNLCRNLKDNPNVGGNLVKIQKERSDLEELLRGTFRDLAENSTFDRLLTTVDDDKKSEQHIEDLISLEKETTEAVRNLEKDLEEEKLEHEQQVKDRKELISTLKQQLREMKTKTVVKMEYARAEAMAKISSKQRTYNQDQKDRERTIKKLERERDVEVMVHDETLSFLETRQSELLGLTLEWNERYEKDVANAEAEFAALTEKRNADYERLSHLRKRREDERIEKAAREAERKRLEELERLQIAKERAEYHAAKKIQGQWKTKQEEDAAAKAASGRKKKNKKKKKK